MRSRAIYYPFIRVPDTPWFTRTLLYWDDVGAIVPSEYLENPELLGDYMVGLVREHLVIQVVPSVHLWRVPRFETAFLDHVDRRGAPPAIVPEEWPNVHMEKLHGIGEGLCHRGLARKDNSVPYSPWYRLEPETAAEFMAYLAAVLGKIPGEKEFVPVTDQVRHLHCFRHRAPSAARRAPIREIVLRRLLPSPVGGIEPSRLAEFKAEHGNELRAFRREIEKRVSHWALIESDADRTYAVREGTRELQGQVNEVAEKMQRARWPQLDFGGLCTIVGGGVAGWSAMATGDELLGLAGAGLSVAPVVYDAFRGADREPQAGPLAYAVLAAAQLQEV